MAQRPKRAWQRMLSGRRLDLLDPTPMDIEIEDIAHGLAFVARWNGQTRGDWAYSVAEHSLLVERIFARLDPGAAPGTSARTAAHTGQADPGRRRHSRRRSARCAHHRAPSGSATATVSTATTSQRSKPANGCRPPRGSAPIVPPSAARGEASRCPVALVESMSVPLQRKSRISTGSQER